MPGIGNSPLGQDVGGVQTWFARDGLGSVRALFNSSAAQVRLTNYDPYGTPLETSGSVSAHLGYTGALTDETGLVYLHARYYAPGSGQFLSADPIEGRVGDARSWNRCGYVGGNPTNLTDPGGKCFSVQLTNDQCGFGSWQHIMGHPGAGGALGMAIAAAVTNIGQAVQNTVSSAWSSVSNAVSQAASGVSDTWTATWNGVNQALQGLVFFANSSNGSAQPQGSGNSSSNSPQPEPVPTPPLPLAEILKQHIPANCPSVNYFGDKIMKWGTGYTDAVNRIQTLTAEELKSNGVTAEMAQWWADFYKQAIANGDGATSSIGRMQLMQFAADLLAGKVKLHRLVVYARGRQGDLVVNFTNSDE